MFKIFLTVVSISVAMGIITMPMRFHQEVAKPHVRTATHLKHNQQTRETYRLNSRRAIFTLNLTFDGLLYELSVDTGSSDIFIKGAGMEGAPENKYSCALCRFFNEKVPIGYLDGRLDTYVYNMTVGLGQHNFYAKILVAYHSDSTNYRDMGGIVGLSFQEKSRSPYPNFISNLIRNKIIDKYMFGVKFNFKNKMDSFITFGGYDTRFIAAGYEIVYHKIPDDKYQYHTKLNRIIVGSAELPIKSALFDTGNTCISIPYEFNDQILSQLNVDGNECNYKPEYSNSQFDLMYCRIANFDSLPSFYFYIDNQIYVIEKQYYIDNCNEPDYNGVRVCATLLESVRKRDDVIIGDTFFLRYYAVFDIDNRRIGLAKNNDHTTIQDVLIRNE